MAELEMCIPYMRRLAEQRTDRIIETSPNGIVILDDRLNILHMNPAFRKMFMCTDSVLGKRISYLMDPDQFERLAAGGEDKLEATVHHPNYRLVCHQVLYPLRDENQYVGIFVNVTRSQEDRERLDQLRVQTIAQAQELLEHQISMAQQIAQALGDSAAKGEKLVSNLVQMVGDEQEPPEGRERGWLGDTYTSR
jgi:PAS domain S-box-containing protein